MDISTLCGAFLCYVLLIMIFDIAIRTIKLGIIQMLAPIPISGYIFKKDNLKKFATTALRVYADLFIRLAIVFLVISTVKILIASDLFKNDTGNWFRNAAIRVALVLGLLMFAKNAPKFLTDLLGIPDTGTGDFKDMFSPGRITGTAGALANPFLNAVSNYRSAMDNNVDILLFLNSVYK